MNNYFRVDENNIVVETLQTTEVVKDSSYIKYDGNLALICGKRWNGSTFEEVPVDEVEEPETTEVTNADLLEVLLAIGEKVGA